MSQVTVRSIHNLAQVAFAGGHGLVIDEPVADGGDGAGPNPYDCLLTALGSCTAITLLMYARRKGWPLEQVEVTLEQERDHAGDCQACADKDAALHRIRRHLTLTGPLSDEQRARLADISRRCPMFKTLSQPVEVIDS